MEQDADDIKIRMSPAEKELLIKYLQKARYYLEYGCGGSTELAVANRVGKIVSVESDEAWVAQLSAKPAMAEAIKKSQLRFEMVDLGPTGAWGKPIDNSKIRNWPKYITIPYEKYDYEFDTVLVDGRFRPACAFAAHAFVRDDAVVLIHDYRTRHGYSEVEKFFSIVDSAENLFVFKKNKVINSRSFYMAVLSSMFRP